jgi:hypothetical protein
MVWKEAAVPYIKAGLQSGGTEEYHDKSQSDMKQRPIKYKAGILVTT